MNEYKFKSALEIQRTRSDFEYLDINSTVGKYQRNLELVKSGTNAAEKTLLMVIIFNIIFSFILLSLNHINTTFFNKDFSLNLIGQFNIFLPLFIAIPVVFAILNNFSDKKSSNKSTSFSILGKIIGTFTILTLIPFISIVISHLLKTQLI